MATYAGDWNNYADVLSCYRDLPPEERMVYACYTYEYYSGSALVVFVDALGVVYENNDGHCSCNGLEDWAPEKTMWEALYMRKGWDGLKEAVVRALIVEAQEKAKVTFAQASFGSTERAMRLRH